MVSPLNNWNVSLTEGLVAEQAVGALLWSEMGVQVKSANKEDKRAIDMSGMFIGDVKLLKSPYPSSPTPSGLQRENHATLDAINVASYPDNALLLLVVDYSAANVPTQGFYFVTAGRVREIVKEFPKRVYSRSSRGFKDKNLKIGVDLQKDCGSIRFPGISDNATGEAIVALVEHLKAKKKAKS